MDSLRSLGTPAVSRLASLDDLFRSLGFTHDDDLAALTHWALEGVRAQNRAEESALLFHARSRVESWFQRTASASFAAGRAAFVLCDLAGLGAGVLTGERALTHEQCQSIRASVLKATPAETRCVMPEQQLELNPLAAFFRRVWQATTTP